MAVETLPPGQGPVPDEPPEAAPHDTGDGSLAAQIAAIEDQRRRLARSLNDGPSQTLSNIVLRAEIVERLLESDPARVREESQRLREAAVSALADVRRFMFEVFPSVLEDLGLVSTLRRYVQMRSSAARLAVELRIEGEERRLNAPAELALFRTVQEALANAEQHSGADRAAVSVVFGADAVAVTVAGRGFATGDVLRQDESRLTGLPGLQAMLVAVDGELAIEAMRDQGTTLTARIRY